jgi:hypothetical protein
MTGPVLDKASIGYQEIILDNLQIKVRDINLKLQSGQGPSSRAFGIYLLELNMVATDKKWNE